MGRAPGISPDRTVAVTMRHHTDYVVEEFTGAARPSQVGRSGPTSNRLLRGGSHRISLPTPWPSGWRSGKTSVDLACSTRSAPRGGGMPWTIPRSAV